MKYTRFSGFLILSTCLLGFLCTGADAIPGLSPVWERLYNDNRPFSETNPDHAVNADPDHDGFSNAAECAAGTDPFSGLPPNGFPQLRIAPHPWMEETFELKIPMTYPGKDYLFSSGTTLQDWTPFPESFPGTGFEMIIPLPPESQGGSPAEKAFFRATISDQPNPGGLFTPWELSVLSTRPDIAGAVLPSVPPNDDSEPPPPDPNSDGSGPNDRYDASPHDKEIDFIRTPESRYIHIPVPGVPQPFTAVDVSDSGKILFGGAVGITDVATQPVGYVWDPSAAPSQRLKPVMFGSLQFSLVCRRTVIDEGDTFPYEQMPLPTQNPPANTSIGLGVNLRSIGDDGSVLGDVSYSLRETDGHPEGHVRSIDTNLVFLWQQNNHQAGRLIGDHRGYSDEGRIVSRDHAVGFLTRPTENSVETLAVTTKQDVKADMNQISPLEIVTTQTATLATGYLNGQITRKGRVEASGGQITRTGRILMPDLINNEFRYVVCGASPTDILPAGTYVEGFSDFPDGQTGSGANQGEWGIGSQGQAFQVRNGNSFKSAPSAHNVLGWDKYGTGIGPSAAQAIWRNGRMHSLSEVVEGAPGGDVRPRKITPSGLVWVGNPEGTTNGLLVPVEVVAPPLEHDETLVSGYPPLGVDELKVAKMKQSLDDAHVLHIDRDPHRFYVQIPGRMSSSPQTRIATDDNPDSRYNDDGTPIDLAAQTGGNFFTSESQMLVSDEVDDSADGVDDRPNDRTHRIQLEGKLKIESVTLGGTAYPLNLKIPVKVKKTVHVNAIRMADCGVTQQDVIDDIRMTNERYAQAGVRVVLDSNEEKPLLENWLDSVVLMRNGDGNPGLRSTQLASLYGTPSNEDIYLFYCLKLRDYELELSGFARAEFSIPDNPQYQNNCFISSGKKVFTVAHEIGHILTNRNHADRVPDIDEMDYNISNDQYQYEHNLMVEGTDWNYLGSTKRLVWGQQILMWHHRCVN